MVEANKIFQLLLGGSAIWLFYWLVNTFFAKSNLDNIPGRENSSFFAGNLHEFFAHDSWDWHAYNAKTFGRVMRIWGPLRKRVLVISDPLALHYLLVKESYTYEFPAWLTESLRLTLGDGLLSSTGHRHKKQRKMLNPVFSAKHMKYMIPMFYDVSQRVSGAISKRLENGPQEIDALDWISRTALELVGVAGLGHSFDTFEEGASPSPYPKAVKKFTPTMDSLVLHQQALPLVKDLVPNWIKRLFIQHFPSKDIQTLGHIVDVMQSTSLDILNEKRRALDANNDETIKEISEGKDLISILLQANRDAAPEDRISDEEVLGQMSTLMFAAFDTTSSALARIIHLLSHNLDVQDKLRAEITEAFQNGDLSYDELVGLPYLEAVCRETLRLYSPAPSITRQNIEDSVLPLSTPIMGNNGKEIDSIHVPKGTNIIANLIACNRDNLIWGDDALEWKPDRWLKSLPESVIDARVPGVYANLMTFSGGPRACIGFKFSQLEMKVVLSVLLSTLVFEPTKDKEIRFNRAGVIWPSVIGGSGKPELPVKVSLVKRA